ncbi:MAG: IS3 family transposase [Lactovum sp.]
MHVKISEPYLFYYNYERIATKLKGLTPIQYRNQSFAISHGVKILSPSFWVHFKRWFLCGFIIKVNL